MASLWAVCFSGSIEQQMKIMDLTWEAPCSTNPPRPFFSLLKHSKTAHQGLFVKPNIVEEVILKKEINKC